MQITKRYLVDLHKFEDWKKIFTSKVYSKIDIFQIYFSGSPETSLQKVLRYYNKNNLAQEDDKFNLIRKPDYFLLIKLNNEFVTTELFIPSTDELSNELNFLMTFSKKKIIKTKYFLLKEISQNIDFTVDVYSHKLQGLAIANIVKPINSQNLDLPDFIGRDITDQKKYSDFKLSETGLPLLYRLGFR